MPCPPTIPSVDFECVCEAMVGALHKEGVEQKFHASQQCRKVNIACACTVNAEESSGCLSMLKSSSCLKDR